VAGIKPRPHTGVQVYMQNVAEKERTALFVPVRGGEEGKKKRRSKTREPIVETVSPSLLPWGKRGGKGLKSILLQRKHKEGKKGRGKKADKRAFREYLLAPPIASREGKRKKRGGGTISIRCEEKGEKKATNIRIEASSRQSPGEQEEKNWTSLRRKKGRCAASSCLITSCDADDPSPLPRGRGKERKKPSKRERRGDHFLLHSIYPHLPPVSFFSSFYYHLRRKGRGEKRETYSPFFKREKGKTSPFHGGRKKGRRRSPRRGVRKKGRGVSTLNPSSLSL